MSKENEKFKLVTTFDNIIIEAVENTYLPQKTESGLILPHGAHKSQETGEIEVTQQLIQVGRVLAIGELVEQVAVGDIIYFDFATVTPIPFNRLNNFVMNERSILAKVVKEEA